MRQIGLIPAGCQQGFFGGVIATKNYLCYASSIAVYFLDAETYRLEKIIAYNSRALSCFTVHPNEDALIVGSLDGLLTSWNVHKEEIIGKVNVGINTQSHADWSYLEDRTAIVVTNSPFLSLSTWAVDSNDMKPLSNPYMLIERLATCLRSNPQVRGVFAVGCEDGAVLVLCSVNKSKKKLLEGSGSVVDMKWDPKSSVYLLVAYSATISLWDTEAGAVVHAFDKQGTGISGIAWLGWTPGSFISSNPRTGVLKVWNASQKQPLESLRVNAAAGILGVAMEPNKPRALCACSDGSVIVFDFMKRSNEFSTPAGHTETVFDCVMSPHDPNLMVTCSFDGHLKLWNISEMKLLQSLYDSNQILYSCDWSASGKLLASSSISGEIIIWNVASGRPVARFAHHKKASYCVRFNPLNDGILCSTSADESAVVFEIDATSLSDTLNVSSGAVLGSDRRKNAAVDDTIVLFNARHPAATFGCAWNPFNGAFFATGCADGIVRVYHYITSAKSKQPIYVLKGHNERVFNCSWSPIVPGLLATGSDDKTIMVWNVPLTDQPGAVPFVERGDGSSGSEGHSLVESLGMSLGLKGRDAWVVMRPTTVLRGHKSNVRALGWNHEHKEFLVSGSWDSSIRVWNVSQSHCVQVVHGHLLDVYTMVAHPKRPFMYISTSRDTTIRLWELEGIFNRMKIRAVLDLSLDRYIDNGSSKESIKSKRKSEADTDSAANNLLNAETGDEGFGEMKVDHGEDSAKFELKLSGKHSKILAMTLRDVKLKLLSIASSEQHFDEADPWTFVTKQKNVLIEVVAALRDVYDFFCGGNGCVQLWTAVLQSIDATLSDVVGGNMLLGKQGQKFSGQAGMIDVNSTVVTHDRILDLAKSHALQLESQVPAAKRSSGTEIDLKYQEVLRKSALMHLRRGDFIKYCTMMIELGSWLEAIAVAPCVSHEFWAGLMQLYAEFVSHEKSSDAAVPYLLAIGKDFDAIKLCLENRDFINGLIISKMSENRTDLIPTDSSEQPFQAPGNLFPVPGMSGTFNSSAPFVSRINSYAAEERKKSKTIRDRTPTESHRSQQWTFDIVARVVKDIWIKSSTISAASQCFIVNDGESAVELLNKSGEYDLALAVARCLGIPVESNTVRRLVVRALYLNDLELGLDIIRRNVRDLLKKESFQTPRRSLSDRMPSASSISGISDSQLDLELELGLYITRFRRPKDATRRDRCLAEFGVPASDEWRRRAVELEALGRDCDAIGAYVIAGDMTQAVHIAIDALRPYILPSNPGEALTLPPNATRVLHRSWQIIASEIIENSERILFLCYMNWFGAHYALNKGLWDVAWKMLRVLHMYIPLAGTFPLSQEDVEYQELFIRILNHESRSHEKLTQMAIQEQTREEHDRRPDPAKEEADPLSLGANKQKQASSAAARNALIEFHCTVRQNCSCACCNDDRSVRNLIDHSQVVVPALLDSAWDSSKSKEFADLRSTMRHLPRIPDPSDLSSPSLPLSADSEEVRLDLGKLPVVYMGSSLPVANHRLARHPSRVSGEAIMGAAVYLDDSVSTMPLNEAAAWRSVNPFSPLMDGSFIEMM